MDQKSRDDDRQVDHPVHREAVHTVTSRCCTRKSVRRNGCIFGVERKGENRRRGIDGQGDGGGSGDETNRVCGIILGGVKERDKDAVVGGVKELTDNDHKSREDVIDIHGGRQDRMW